MAKLKASILSYPAEQMEVYPVSSAVRYAKNESAELVVPLTEAPTTT